MVLTGAFVRAMSVTVSKKTLGLAAYLQEFGRKRFESTVFPADKMTHVDPPPVGSPNGDVFGDHKPKEHAETQEPYVKTLLIEPNGVELKDMAEGTSENILCTPHMIYILL